MKLLLKVLTGALVVASPTIASAEIPKPHVVFMTPPPPMPRMDNFGVQVLTQQSSTRAMNQLPSIHAGNALRSPVMAGGGSTGWGRSPITTHK